MPTLGIDVSHFNGEIDWAAVARSNVRFAYAKATEGISVVDARFEANWAGLGATSLLRGAYHFARPSRDPLQQAAHFASVVARKGLRELPPALDLETDNGLAAAEVVSWTLAFVAEAEQLFGRKLVIYTGGLWRRDMGDPLVPELSSRLLWTARYGAHEPVIPRTWARWDFWQFTDGESGDVQTIPGVKGHCDCDRFRGDLAELQALAAPAQP